MNTILLLSLVKESDSPNMSSKAKFYKTIEKSKGLGVELMVCFVHTAGYTTQKFLSDT